MNCDQKAAMMDLVSAGEKLVNSVLKKKSLSFGQLKKLAAAVDFGKFQLQNESKQVGFAMGV